ncbi:RNA polymerase sigma factor [Flocculibacter collagenilyticus]|uniref:RNA polymerase sigma factor n=1 Tax=Flocculibacter collagenilyticus TaxID=2744479 RepID=UPI0018F39BC0|nr:sigma-70 family RNA polymerase sigma factor [Flocculibacter collagenilyticus]
MFAQTDEKLISKAISGNERAWLKLVKRYETAIFHYCLRMVGNPDDATDLMQEVFIGICRNLSSFRGDSSFKTWALKIAHFRSVEYYRRKKEFTDIDQIDEPADESGRNMPDKILHQWQNNQQLLQALKCLPFNQKIVIELKFFQHLTCEQIAHNLGISTNTVKSRLYSGLDKLKVYLEVHDEFSQTA